MRISLGLGEYRVGLAADEEWVMYGLGSCIGLILCDPRRRICGAAHIVLPSAQDGRDTDSPGRYADTAVPFLLSQMEALGADRRAVYAQAAGGAQMLALRSLGNIGPRNIDATKKVLAEQGIPLVAERTGGMHGRTLALDLRTGIATVRRVGQPDEVMTPLQYAYREVIVDGPRVGR